MLEMGRTQLVELSLLLVSVSVLVLALDTHHIVSV